MVGNWIQLNLKRLLTRQGEVLMNTRHPDPVAGASSPRRWWLTSAFVVRGGAADRYHVSEDIDRSDVVPARLHFFTDMERYK